MRKFRGQISTDFVGSSCDFEFEVEDDATQDEIEREAKEAAFDCVNWNYEDVEL